MKPSHKRWTFLLSVLSKCYSSGSRFVATGALMYALVPFNTALALSCARSSLQQSYDASIYIVIAKIGNCTKNWGAARESCKEWELEIEEVIKGEKPPQKLLTGGMWGYYPQAGEIRLLFTSDEAAFYASPCSRGRKLYTAGWEHVEKDIDRMRDYRDGVIADLSPLWHFRQSSNGNCIITHYFDAGSLRLDYNVSRNSQNQPSSDQFLPGVVTTIEGVEYQPHSPHLIVKFRRFGTFNGVAVKVGQQIWPLEKQTIRWSTSSPRNSKVVKGEGVNHIIQGAAVLELLNTMIPSGSLTIEADYSSTGSLENSDDTVQVDYEVKTTHISEAAKQFRECMAMELKAD